MIIDDNGNCDTKNNSFGLGVTLSDKEFISVDESELIQPRQPNGDLPA